MTEDNWLSLAMSDNDVVADLLLRLRLPVTPPPRPAPPQSWTIRRSRTQPLIPPSTKSDTPRASPSTPLSWSGGPAQLPDDAFDSTQPIHNCSDASRSKIRPPGETTPTKRPRKKKTLAALKEEGIVLMEEQNDLKKKIAALRANCEKQREENKKLKKIKLDLQIEPQSERPKAMINNHFEVVNERKDKAILPDLNVPFGEDVIVSC